MRNKWNVTLVCVITSMGAAAQSTGTINGRVTDQTGAVLPGATVTLTNTATGLSRTANATGEGDYTVPALTPGVYTVVVEASGFAKQEKTNATLVTGSTLSLNFSLSLATSVEHVEVTLEAPLIEVTQSGVSNSLQTGEVQSLPILNRTFSGLVALVPSARPAPPSSNAKISLGGGLGFGGGAGRNGAVQVDGMTLRDDANGGALYNVTLEGVQEFTVVAHDYPAEYGLSSGGVVLITTKSGSNRLHGSAFAFGRNQDMTTLDYLSDPANGGTGKPPYSRMQFGGSLGLPLIKDKFFLFGAGEYTRLNQAIEWPGSVTSQATILKNALIGLTSCPICVTVGNAIGPAAYAPETIRDLQTSLRSDYQINSHHSVFFRYVGERGNTYDDILQQQGGVTHPDNDPNGSNNVDTLRGYNGVLSETWLLGNNAVNTLAVSGSHFYDIQSCNCTLTGPTQIYRNITFPDFQVGAQTGATNTTEIEDNIQITDTYARQVGTHALKAGVEYMDFPRMGFDRGVSGGVTFFADPSVIFSTPSIYPQGLLTPGAMKSVVVSTTNFGGAAAHARIHGGKEAGFFVQDDWKVKPNMTLNLGLRYTVNVNFFNQNQQLQNRAYQLLNTIGSPWGKTVNTPFRDFSPRVGFAWDIGGKGKNIVKGSFGIYFDEALAVNQISIDPLAQTTLQNISATFTNTAVGVGQAATVAYGGALPTTLSSGLTNFLPGGNSSLTWMEPGMTDPYNQQSHIGYSRQLSKSAVITADYTHILGLHELHAEPINPQENTAWDPNAASYNTCGLTGTYRRLQCAFNTATSPGTIGAVTIVGSSNRSQFDEFILHFEQRGKRVVLQANYILSWAYGFGGSIAGTGTNGGATAAQVPFQWHTPSEWGPSQTDERNRVVLSGTFNLPWGIQAAPIFQFGTARPYNCLVSSDYTKSGSNTTRCVQDASGNLVAPPTQYPLASGTSTVPVNFLRGTATWDLDTRITKTIPLHKEMNVNVFAELYNLTNKSNFGNNYGGTYGTATFMKPLGYLNQGLSLPTSRQLQLGARFTF